MGNEKKPVHGQIRIDEDGRPAVWIGNNTPENPRKSDTITPDSIRDKELEGLRGKLRKANIATWVLFFVGLVVGVLATWLLTPLWG